MTVRTVQHTMPLRDAWELGLSARDVHVPPGATSLTLYDLALIEDDGPGASTWYAPCETVRGPLQAKKVFDVRRPQATAARLVVVLEPFDGETAPLVVRVNGRELEFAPAGCGWNVLPIPPDVIRKGRNEVVFACSGDRGWRVPIALREAILRNDPSRKKTPARSFRSTDGGRTWSTRLGDGRAVSGEYMARLSLDQYAAEGELIGPVIDLARTAGGDAVGPPIAVKSLRLLPQAQTPPRTSIEYHVRSGTNPVCGMRGWGRWVRCDRSGRAPGSHRRFVQWRAVLKTRFPTATPVLQSVGLQAEIDERRPDWAAAVTVADSHNEVIRTTSIPFEYERFDAPELRALRKTYRLDKVVAGAKTELEKMLRLRNWVAAQWTYLPHGLPHPEWDAREILDRHSGVCVQYAIVYMQCALSLGMQTRFVFGNVPGGRLPERSTGGHEVNEFWSNEHGRWCYMDARQDDTYVDARTGLPVSMLDFHNETLNVYFADRPISLDVNRFKKKLPSPRLRLQKGKAPAADAPAEVPILWACLCWMPRNNFYGRRYPQPIAQGRGSWSWTGYWRWVDQKSPPQYQFRHHTSRRSDIEWTINQVRFAAAFAAQPGLVEIRLGTVTPDFDTFLINIDGKGWMASGDRVQWQLCPGRNRIEMRIQNRAGVLGKPSRLELDYVQHVV